MAAFTATATERVRRDIVRLLDLRDPYEVVTGFDRPNLYFGVERLEPKRKVARIASYALEHPLESGIVYCSTRKDTDKVHAALVAAGVRATRYHAGMSAADRTESQRAFITDDAPVMVATNAFGMGIDKSNVRYVVHHNMPGSLEAYYQEAGRAGRDGEPSTCLLFWSDGDVSTCRFFIEQESGNEELTPKEADAVRASRRRLLEAMCGYCLTTGCLRRYILDYFGDQQVPPACQPAEQAGAAEVSGTESCGSKPSSRPEGRYVGLSSQSPALENPSLTSRTTGDFSCGNCSNCKGDFEAVDVTDTARAVMRCVQELRGRFGKGMVVDVLRGSQNAKVLDLHLDQAASFHTVDAPASQVKEVVELLAAGGYLAITEGSYPVVGLGPRGREAAEEGFSLSMKRVVRKAERAQGGRRRRHGGRHGVRRFRHGVFRRGRAGAVRAAAGAAQAPGRRGRRAALHRVFRRGPCATCARSCLPPKTSSWTCLALVPRSSRATVRRSLRNWPPGKGRRRSRGALRGVLAALRAKALACKADGRCRGTAPGSMRSRLCLGGARAAVRLPGTRPRRA